MRIIIITSFLFFLFNHCFAQLSLTHRFESRQDSLFAQKNGDLFPKNAADSASFAQILRGGILALQRRTLLESSVDSVEFKTIINEKDTTKQAIIHWHLGKPYKWGKLRNGNVDAAFLAQIGFREGLSNGKPMLSTDIFETEDRLLTYAENNGYPFARVWLDSIVAKNGEVSAALMMQTGAVFVIDSIRTEGSAKINLAFLQNYLDLRKGMIFSRAKVLKISQRLAELPYLTEKKRPSVNFTDIKTARLTLFLENKKASQWDFLVGVQPTTTADGAQKFLITFNGKADFQNVLGRGERLFLNFENVRPESPRVNVKVTYPFILNLPFGFDGAFDLYKRDTTYLEIRSNIGGQYMLGGSDYIKIFWQNYKANNLLINGLQIISTKKLPATLDVTTNMLGIEGQRQTLDYRFNPRRGFLGILRGSAGIRQVYRNSDILALTDPNNLKFDFSKLYDTVTFRSFQYRIDAKADVFFPIQKRATLKMGITSGILLTPSPISQNEQYRLGGSRLLRGFDEESLFATHYAVGTLEYRLLIGRNSYLYAFGDAGYIQNLTRTNRSFDTPIGMGAGITFETRVGLFGVSLAIGKQAENPFDFRNVKTHFGYVSLF
jgi:outer membrane protein assembly factor BamA